MSATLHNIQDVADWLRVPSNGLKVFGEEMRPVKLTTIVKGYESTKTECVSASEISARIMCCKVAGLRTGKMITIALYVQKNAPVSKTGHMSFFGSH